MVDLEPVPDEPVLQADDILVVADLHIGLEEELREKGIHVPSRAEAMGRKLSELAERRGATRIVILGDVKHLVPKMASRERRDVYVFFRDLASTFREIYIAQGNHDGMLKHIVPRNVRFKPAYGFRIEDTGFCHGHAWPFKKVMDTKVLVMGRIHPSPRRNAPGPAPRHSRGSWLPAERLPAMRWADGVEMEVTIPVHRRDRTSDPRLARYHHQRLGDDVARDRGRPHGVLAHDANHATHLLRPHRSMALWNRGRLLVLAVVPSS